MNSMSKKLVNKIQLSSPLAGEQDSIQVSPISNNIYKLEQVFIYLMF